MLRHPLRTTSLLLLAALFGWSASADAKPKKGKEPPAEEVKLEEESGDKKDAAEEKSSDESAAGEEGEKGEGSEAGDEEKKEEGSGEAASPKDSGTDDGSPVEDPNKTYYFVGARARAVVVPAFIIEAFGDGGKPVIGPSFGPEFSIRKDGFEWIFAASYTAYPMQDVPFKAPSDPDTSMELVTSEIKVFYLTADFYWSKDFSPQFSFLYGGGAGLGIVWGPLYRSQAYPVDGGWAYCPGEPPATPDPYPPYCEADADHEPNQHYQGYEEPNWFDGGSKPVVMPWLNIQAGLRYKPHRNFVARLDVGIGLGQIFFGLGADYGL
ncbi:MAG TPA: hypothetical protein VGK73_28390 [Polyangiaceae bacterium]